MEPRLPFPHSCVPATFWSLDYNFFEDIKVLAFHVENTYKAHRPLSDQSLRNSERLSVRGKKQWRGFTLSRGSRWLESKVLLERRHCPIFSPLISVTVSHNTVRVGTEYTSLGTEFDLSPIKE